MEGDGDLDIVGGSKPPFLNTVYLNDGLGNFVAGSSFGTAASFTQSVAVGDLNGDGALDIIAGNTGSASQIYINAGAGAFTAPSLFGAGVDVVKLGDIDGNGSIDILTSNDPYGTGDGRSNDIFLNDGTGVFKGQREFGLASDVTSDFALGDLDGNGTLDIAVANIGQAGTIHLNQLGRSSGMPNSPPVVRLARPGPTADADFFSTPAVLTSPVISLTYTLSDTEGDVVRRVVPSSRSTAAASGRRRSLPPARLPPTWLHRPPARPTPLDGTLSRVVSLVSPTMSSSV